VLDWLQKGGHNAGRDFYDAVESTPRPSEEKLPSSTSQFVAFNKNEQLTFKDLKNQGVDHASARTVEATSFVRHLAECSQGTGLPSRRK
jgi:hypothetical protein